jgi:hypothetical protein
MSPLRPTRWQQMGHLVDSDDLTTISPDITHTIRRFGDWCSTCRRRSSSRFPAGPAARRASPDRGRALTAFRAASAVTCYRAVTVLPRFAGQRCQMLHLSRINEYFTIEPAGATITLHGYILPDSEQLAESSHPVQAINDAPEI